MSPAAQDILAFWFAGENAASWFASDPAFDAQIRGRFGETAKMAADGALDDWATMPPGWLALLILLDQFSRNLHRQDSRAWGQDTKALALALAGIERGDDQQLPPLQRAFAYLPLEHAEDLAMQLRCVALFEALCAAAMPAQRTCLEGFLDFARRHLDVIERFGRFPHRNALLGRPSTPAELIFLAMPGAGF
jgi:uncharacterized protein (DUF924 family)